LTFLRMPNPRLLRAESCEATVVETVLRRHVNCQSPSKFPTAFRESTEGHPKVDTPRPPSAERSTTDCEFPALARNVRDRAKDKSRQFLMSISKKKTSAFSGGEFRALKKATVSPRSLNRRGFLLARSGQADSYLLGNHALPS